MDLLSEWSAWEPNAPPFLLEADRTVLDSPRSSGARVMFQSWSEAYSDPNFGKPGDSRLHLGLLPAPYVGNLRQASVYVLLLNPGVGPEDYYGEYEVPAYRNALLANLKQNFGSGRKPFLFLDPQYSWHSGYKWWHGKLVAVIYRLARELNLTFASARARLATELASLELIPYHSATFRNQGGWLQSLTSVELARAFARDVVFPRVERGEAVVIAARQAQLWSLPEHPSVIRYSAKEARAAHLTPQSRGGRAILEQLLRRGS